MVTFFLCIFLLLRVNDSRILPLEGREIFPCVLLKNNTGKIKLYCHSGTIDFGIHVEIFSFIILNISGSVGAARNLMK